MRRDLIGAINEAFEKMNEDERRAYSAGMSHVYADVFAIFEQMFATGQNLSEAFRLIQERWDYVRDIQKAKGILP